MVNLNCMFYDGDCGICGDVEDFEIIGVFFSSKLEVVCFLRLGVKIYYICGDLKWKFKNDFRSILGGGNIGFGGNVFF